MEEEFSLIRSSVYRESAFRRPAEGHWELDDPEGSSGLTPSTPRGKCDQARHFGAGRRRQHLDRLSVLEHDDEVSVTDNGVGMEVKETIRMLLNGETDFRYSIGRAYVNQRIAADLRRGTQDHQQSGRGHKISFMIHRPSRSIISPSHRIPLPPRIASSKPPRGKGLMSSRQPHHRIVCGKIIARRALVSEKSTYVNRNSCAGGIIFRESR